ncbi:hypothetical protein GBAR_LOCUS17454 [Geodia barretti]|uniref:Uncharacterized protein n=1 Tax=Geodia barretti TaxID=519541 RepID=A0AA35SL83_GEOBA|nr:hypothetical protein GBAR_LOCUS17454 [Geodia barretti]
MFHMPSAVLVVFFIIEQWFLVYCISIVSGSINSPSPC